MFKLYIKYQQNLLNQVLLPPFCDSEKFYKHVHAYHNGLLKSTAAKRKQIKQTKTPPKFI